MYRYNFQNDYSEGAAPKILEALTKTNFTQELGYGEDQYSLEAIKLIRQVIGNEDADVHFVSGGTQANIIVLSSILKPFESVIAVESGHICVHETGAIEATGHKINTIQGKEGKVTVEEINSIAAGHGDEHMVRPRVVFISHSSEVGTIYTAKELTDIADACKKLNLYLYMDGARLGSALTSKKADLDIKEITRLVDAFYIGGTKNGALLGEAIVINNPILKQDFRYHIKQKGGLLSKGRLLGIQFLELFKDNLYFNLAQHANAMAEKLTFGIANLGYSFQTNSSTNQIFPIFPNNIIDELSHHYRFYVWAKVDEKHSSIRLVTSWATHEEAIDGFIKELTSHATQRL